MAVTLKSQKVKYKNEYGNYVGIDAIAQQSTEEEIAAIEAQGQQEITAIEAKGQQTRDSIPSDYTALSDEVSDLKSALDIKMGMGVVLSQLPFTISDNKLLTSSGSVITHNTYMVIECDITNMSGYLRIGSYNGYGSGKYAFYDANDTVISIATASVAESKAFDDIEIPQNAVKVKACGRNYHPYLIPSICALEYEDYVTESNSGIISDLLVPDQFEEISYSWTAGAYQFNNNAYISAASVKFMKINVESNEYYRIIGNTYYSYNLYGIIIDGIVTWFPNYSGEGRFDIIIKIPSGNNIELIVHQPNGTTTTISKANSYVNGRMFLGKKVAIVGDSIIEASAQVPVKFYDNIRFRSGLEFVNLGISGTGYKNGGSNNNKAYYQRLSDIPNDVDAVLFYGSGNDNQFTAGTPADNTTDTVSGCVNKTINDLLTLYPNIKIGVITAYPWQSWKPDTDNNMQTIANNIVQICRNNSIPVLDLYHESNLRPWIPANNTALFLNADGTHVNVDGHKIITPIIFEFIKTLLMS